MPHISIKMYPGRDEQTKQQLAEKTRDFFASEMKADKKYFSVSVEDVSPENWDDEVVSKIPEKNLYIKSNF